MQMTCPRGFNAVEHDDSKVHAIDLTEMEAGVQLWRNTPVCGTATGPSSDEAGKDSWLMLLEITCRDCIAILG